PRRRHRAEHVRTLARKLRRAEVGQPQYPGGRGVEPCVSRRPRKACHSEPMTIVTIHYRYKRPPRKRNIARCADHRAGGQSEKGRRPVGIQAVTKDCGVNGYWLFCCGATFQSSALVWTGTGAVENGGMSCETTSWI